MNDPRRTTASGSWWTGCGRGVCARTQPRSTIGARTSRHRLNCANGSTIADRFDEFKKRYRLELKGNPELAEFRKLTKSGKVTLLYAARDETVNHAVVLAEYIRALKAKG